MVSVLETHVPVCLIDALRLQFPVRPDVTVSDSA